MKKYVIFLLPFIISCGKEFRLGDRVRVTEGFYKDCSGYVTDYMTSSGITCNKKYGVYNLSCSFPTVTVYQKYAYIENCYLEMYK